MRDYYETVIVLVVEIVVVTSRLQLVKLLPVERDYCSTVGCRKRPKVKNWCWVLLLEKEGDVSMNCFHIIILIHGYIEYYIRVLQWVCVCDGLRPALRRRVLYRTSFFRHLKNVENVFFSWFSSTQSVLFTFYTFSLL